MANQISPGTTVFILRDILIEGQTAFTLGQSVVIESVSPNPARPEFKYVVYSPQLQKRFQLSDDDVSAAQSVHPDSVRGSAESVNEGKPTELPVGDSERFPEHSCLHRYENSPDGSLTCSKCGKNISRTGERLPDVPTTCSSCGNPLSDSSFICGSCGAPNIGLVQRRAILEQRNVKRCRHSFRYMPDQQQKICVNCAKVVPLKTPSGRRMYAIALGAEICIYCGAKKTEGHILCETCGKQYEVIEPLPQKEYDPKKMRFLGLDGVSQSSQRPPRTGAVSEPTDAQSSLGTDTAPSNADSFSPPIQQSEVPKAPSIHGGWSDSSLGQLSKSRFFGPVVLGLVILLSIVVVLVLALRYYGNIRGPSYDNPNGSKVYDDGYRQGMSDAKGGRAISTENPPTMPEKYWGSSEFEFDLNTVPWYTGYAAGYVDGGGEALISAPTSP